MPAPPARRPGPTLGLVQVAVAPSSIPLPRPVTFTARSATLRVDHLPSFPLDPSAPRRSASRNAKTGPRAGLTSGSPPVYGGPQRAAGGSEPPVRRATFSGVSYLL